MSDEITIIMSYKDYLEANQFRVRQKWALKHSAKFITMTAVLCAAIFSFGEISDRGFSITTLLICLLMGLIWAIFAYGALRLWLLWCLPRSAKKLYAQQPSASAPIQFSFDADGFKAVGPFETSNLPWSHLLGYMENDRLLLLSRTSITFFCLPKAQLGEANSTALKQCLAAAGVKQGL